MSQLVILRNRILPTGVRALSKHDAVGLNCFQHKTFFSIENCSLFSVRLHAQSRRMWGKQTDR